MLTASWDSSIAPIKLSSASIALGGMRPPFGACRVRGSDSICVIRPQWSRVLCVCNKKHNVGKYLCLITAALMITSRCHMNETQHTPRQKSRRVGNSEHRGLLRGDLHVESGFDTFEQRGGHCDSANFFQVFRHVDGVTIK